MRDGNLPPRCLATLGMTGLLYDGWRTGIRGQPSSDDCLTYRSVERTGTTSTGSAVLPPAELQAMTPVTPDHGD
jgi:hypothetical protein